MVSFFSILILYAARSHTGSRLFNKMKNSLMHKETDTFFPLHCIKPPHYCTSSDLRRSLETLKDALFAYLWLDYHSLIVTHVKKKISRGGKYIFWLQLFTCQNKQNNVFLTNWVAFWIIFSIDFSNICIASCKIVALAHSRLHCACWFHDVEFKMFWLIPPESVSQHTLDMASTLW